MAFLIMVILCILGIVMPKSRGASILILLYMWIFYGFSTYSGDYISYQYVYDSMKNGLLLFHFEPAFSLLMLFCSKLGLSFTGFKIVLSSIFIAMLAGIVKKYTNYTAFVLAMFLIFPFSYFASVLRAGIAGLIIVYGIDYLVPCSQKENKGKYLLCVLAAMLFHTSSLFFLVFLLAGKEVNIKRILSILIVMSGVVIAYYFGFFYYIISFFTNSEKILSWLTYESANNLLNWKGVLSQIFVLMGIVWCIRKSKNISNHVLKVSGQPETCENKVRLHQTVFNCNVWMCLLIPFFFITSVWMRFLWEFSLINICVCANTIEIVRVYSKKPSGRKLVVPVVGIILFFGQILLLYYTNMPYRGTTDSVWLMFKNNLIFERFLF
ncbi:EpsG family protein [Lachnospiraceae bacterium KK002]